MHYSYINHRLIMSVRCIFNHRNGLGATSVSGSDGENDDKNAELPSSVDITRDARKARKAEHLAAAAAVANPTETT